MGMISSFGGLYSECLLAELMCWAHTVPHSILAIKNVSVRLISFGLNDFPKTDISFTYSKGRAKFKQTMCYRPSVGIVPILQSSLDGSACFAALSTQGWPFFPTLDLGLASRRGQWPAGVCRFQACLRKSTCSRFPSCVPATLWIQDESSLLKDVR